MPGFDFMHQLLRISFGWYEIKPSACDHQLVRQPEHAVGNGIAMVVIAEQPGIEVALAKGRLN